MLLLERFTGAQLDERPSLLELLDLLEKESHHDILLLLLQSLLPFDEKVLECEIALLSESEPLLLVEPVKLRLESIEEAPGSLGLVEFALHHVVVLELWLCLAKMLRIDI